MRDRAAGSWLLLTLAGLLLSPAASAVDIDWVSVEGAGNDCDPQMAGCFGAVADVYQIARTEVTNSQYAEFLNAVAASDPNALYSHAMGLFPGGITRGGDPGSFSYVAIASRQNKPVNFVSFYDSLRFANWLHNGQPTGGQDSTTTEDGAYTFSGPTSVDARNASATIFLTSEDEWYKAAYYDVLSASYLDHPAASNAPTVCAAPGAAANTANCGDSTGDLGDVGGYPGSTSPSGTLDQGGNAWEWNEAQSAPGRGVRGGAFLSESSALAAAFRSGREPSGEFENVGFRVATVPEPAPGMLVMAGLLALGFCRRRWANPSP